MSVRIRWKYTSRSHGIPLELLKGDFSCLTAFICPMSKILAIDTSSTVCRVGLANNGELIRQCSGDESRRAAQEVLPLIQQLLQAEKLELGDLDVLAVNTGPGSFTGLRIGIGVVQALAYTLKLPIVSIPSMALLAWAGMKQQGLSECLIFEQAREPEVYFAHYVVDRHRGAQLQGNEQIAACADLQITLSSGTSSDLEVPNTHFGLLGAASTTDDVVTRLSQLGIASAPTFATIVPAMEEFCELVAVKFENEGADDELVLPNYVKEQMDYS